MRYQGKITGWKDEKGFGFIAPNNGGSRVFAHIKSFTNRQRRPTDNEIVTYDLKMDDNGRAQAERVAFVDEPVRTTRSSGRGNFAVLFTVAFLLFAGAAAVAGMLPYTALGVYFVASMIAFVAYALDKSAAQNNRRRTPENTLHLLALLGGWPGALAAQKLLRHKSRKQSFQIVFWATVVVHCSVVIWLFLFSGATMLRTIAEAARV